MNTDIASFTPDNFLFADLVVPDTLAFAQEFNSPLSAGAGGSSTVWRTDYGWGATSNSVGSIASSSAQRALKVN